ncbi:Asp23/Gls24 family envelope stress response protein [Streptomyces sp. LP05-1]|uniref:Asp23/Gls24 family envelope stress response protein n=1 Tax=Streptomyces pyxinae TaxID=2970734 RepID=A0ABT2CIN1_9ACTN|nr:Asp23/Gls24 family envelope stress response protein [Streptomyces sp. LP05-1]MCS0637267.1 Asp23/Gls24 family envelope stress response protein [Streptomyces sp. LP05-1]
MAADRIEPADRGATTIADRVVAKIAARAAREALGSLPEGGDPPRASVLVRRDSARVHVTLDLGYPSDIGAQCGAVRGRVSRRVRQLAGMTVPEVAVRVERLLTPYDRNDQGGRDGRGRGLR